MATNGDDVDLEGLASGIGDQLTPDDEEEQSQQGEQTEPTAAPSGETIEEQASNIGDELTSQPQPEPPTQQSAEETGAELGEKAAEVAESSNVSTERQSSQPTQPAQTDPEKQLEQAIESGSESKQSGGVEKANQAGSKLAEEAGEIVEEQEPDTDTKSVEEVAEEFAEEASDDIDTDRQPSDKSASQREREAKAAAIGEELTPDGTTPQEQAGDRLAEAVEPRDDTREIDSAKAAGQELAEEIQEPRVPRSERTGSQLDRQRAAEQFSEELNRSVEPSQVEIDQGEPRLYEPFREDVQREQVQEQLAERGLIVPESEIQAGEEATLTEEGVDRVQRQQAVRQLDRRFEDRRITATDVRVGDDGPQLRDDVLRSIAAERASEATDVQYDAEDFRITDSGPQLRRNVAAATAAQQLSEDTGFDFNAGDIDVQRTDDGLQTTLTRDARREFEATQAERQFNEQFEVDFEVGEELRRTDSGEFELTESAQQRLIETQLARPVEDRATIEVDGAEQSFAPTTKEVQNLENISFSETESGNLTFSVDRMGIVEQSFQSVLGPAGKLERSIGGAVGGAAGAAASAPLISDVARATKTGLGGAEDLGQPVLGPAGSLEQSAGDVVFAGAEVTGDVAEPVTGAVSKAAPAVGVGTELLLNPTGTANQLLEGKGLNENDPAGTAITKAVQGGAQGVQAIAEIPEDAAKLGEAGVEATQFTAEKTLEQGAPGAGEAAAAGAEATANLTDQAVRQTIENPFRAAGMLGAAYAGGSVAAQGAERAATAARLKGSRLRGRLPGRGGIQDSVDLEDVTTQEATEGNLPKFETSPSAPTERAVKEVRRRAKDNPEKIKSELDSEGVLFRSEAERLGREVEAGRGKFELPGLFASPDLSPLRLQQGKGSSIPTPSNARLPRLAGRPQRTSAFEADDIRAMPEQASGSGIVVRGGERMPDPETSGARFLDESANRGTAFVRPRGSRTTELEAIYPPGSRFKRVKKFGLNTPKGRSATLDLFRRIDADDVDDVKAGRRGADSDDILTREELIERSRRARRLNETPPAPVPPLTSTSNIGSSRSTVSETTAPIESSSAQTSGIRASASAGVTPTEGERTAVDDTVTSDTTDLLPGRQSGVSERASTDTGSGLEVSGSSGTNPLEQTSSRSDSASRGNVEPTSEVGGGSQPGGSPNTRGQERPTVGSPPTFGGSGGGGSSPPTLSELQGSPSESPGSSPSGSPNLPGVPSTTNPQRPFTPDFEFGTDRNEQDENTREPSPRKVDEPLDPGWYNEFVLARATSGGGQRKGPGEDVLRSQPATSLLTGQLPTAAEAEGPEELQEEIEEEASLLAFADFGFGDGDEGGLL